MLHDSENQSIAPPQLEDIDCSMVDTRTLQTYKEKMTKDVGMAMKFTFAPNGQGCPGLCHYTFLFHVFIMSRCIE